MKILKKKKKKKLIIYKFNFKFLNNREKIKLFFLIILNIYSFIKYNKKIFN
jgi:hypothetical protein